VLAREDAAEDPDDGAAQRAGSSARIRREIAYAPANGARKLRRDAPTVLPMRSGPAYENELRYGALIETTGFNP
jgi:hypothetical protein